MTNALLNQVQQAIEENKVQLDMTETKAGGFEKRLLPEGTAVVQFTRYIDLGTQKQRAFQGKAKNPIRMAKLGFHIVAGMGVDEEGNRVAYVQDGNFPILNEPFDLALYQNEKAKSVAIFKAMNYAKDATHYVQKLGQLYLLQIGVEEYKDAQGKTAKRNKWDLAKLQPPVINAMTGDVAVAGENGIGNTPDDGYEVFLWDAPTKEQWDSIHIEGTYKKKITNEDGSTTEKDVSKNFIQEQIQRATDFIGSPIERLLMSEGVELPTLEAEAEPEHQADTTPNDVPDVPEIKTTVDVPDVPAI